MRRTGLITACMMGVLAACGGENGGTPAVNSAAFGPLAPPDGLSAFSTLDLDACSEETLNNPEGVETFKCKGLPSLGLFVSRKGEIYEFDAQAWDRAFDADEVKPGEPQERIEWRQTAGGRTEAVIVEFVLADGARESRVYAVATQARDACLLGVVSADAVPDMRTAARTLADQARGIDCEGV